MRRVYTAENVFDAYLVRDRLIEQDIDAVVQGELLAGAIGELPLDTRPTVWIREDDLYETARSVVTDFENGQVAGSPWHCRNCGEYNEGAFALCWNCSRPAQ